MKHHHVDRFMALIASIAAGMIFVGLPHVFLPFPGWLPLVVVALIDIPLILENRICSPRVRQRIGYVLVLSLFGFLAISVGAWVYELSDQTKRELVRPVLLPSGAMMWFANVLVFTLWYWRFDGQGPHMRRVHRRQSSFLFPQMTLPEELKEKLCVEHWAPTLLDYFFLAWNTSTALSPTDTPVLGREAKLTTMLQSAISVTIVVVLIARAVNVM